MDETTENINNSTELTREQKRQLIEAYLADQKMRQQEAKDITARNETKLQDYATQREQYAQDLARLPELQDQAATNDVINNSAGHVLNGIEIAAGLGGGRHATNADTRRALLEKELSAKLSKPEAPYMEKVPGMGSLPSNVFGDKKAGAGSGKQPKQEEGQLFDIRTNQLVGKGVTTDGRLTGVFDKGSNKLRAPTPEEAANYTLGKTTQGALNNAGLAGDVNGAVPFAAERNTMYGRQEEKNVRHQMAEASKDLIAREKAADTALTLLNENNGVALKALGTQLARLFGDTGALSNRDVDIANAGGVLSQMETRFNTEIGADGVIPEKLRQDFIRVVNQFKKGAINHRARMTDEIVNNSSFRDKAGLKADLLNQGPAAAVGAAPAADGPSLKDRAAAELLKRKQGASK